MGLANRAYETGSYLFWSGHLDLAEPLYRIAAQQNSGAASELASAIRLSLMKGELEEVMQITLGRAQRYNDTYAYRDYLGILHAAGYSPDAWAGFSHLVQEMPQRPHVWETALVGHHREGRTEADVLAWVQRPEYAKTGAGMNAAAIYLLRFATTDRTPSAGLADAIQRIDVPVWQLENPERRVVRPPMNGEAGLILGPDIGSGRAVLPVGAFERAPKKQVRSNLAYFAAAYRELKLKNYPAAKVIFDEAVSLYDLRADSLFMLPYYALAQTLGGGRRELERQLARMAPNERSFDYWLAQAVLRMAVGNQDAALQSLALARHNRPHTEERPLLTQHTFGEIAELLYEQSGDARFRERALEWARGFQTIEPWQSWSYAMEARLAKNPVDRARAMAMAYALDPKSERLSWLKKQDIDQAVKTYGASSPFRILRNKLEKSDAT